MMIDGEVAKHGCDNNKEDDDGKDYFLLWPAVMKVRTAPASII